jgi:hypothetical protein
MMTDADIAMDFMYGLDNTRYADFKTSTVNNITQGLTTGPKDLNEMYIFASRLVVVRKQQPIAGGASFVTADTRTKNRNNRAHQRNNNKTKNDNDKDKEKTVMTCQKTMRQTKRKRE